MSIPESVKAHRAERLTLCQALASGASVLALCAVLALPARSQAPSGNEAAAAAKSGATADTRSEIILEGLPQPGTKLYKELIAHAGPTAKGQVLTMSKAEMWSMPSARVERVIQEAIKKGVRVTRLGEDWNHILHGMTPAAGTMSDSAMSMMEATKRIPSTMSVGMMAAPRSAMVEYALTKDKDRKLADREQPHLVIPLGDGTSLKIRRQSVETTKTGCIWRGTIEGTDEPVTLMWWTGGRLAGNFQHRGRMYSLKNLGGDAHAVVETDPKMMPDEHGGMPTARMKTDSIEAKGMMSAGNDPLVNQGEARPLMPFYTGAQGTRLLRPDAQELENLKDAVDPRTKRQPKKSADLGTGASKKAGKAASTKADGPAPVTITVMVAYTRKAASYYSAIQNDVVALGIEETNQAFKNSKIGHIELKLVHTYMTDYDETGSVHFDHVYRLADRGDGYLEEVHALRNKHKADIVLLVVDDRSGCGLATRVAAEAEEAFAVVHHECAVTSYTLAHEVGHLLGARHDKSLDQSTTPFQFGFGYVNNTKWRTMMAYKSSCGDCPRLPIFSNPEIKYKGEPVGTELTNNAKAITIRAPIVAGFR